MKNANHKGPADLMYRGRMDEAAQVYLDVYVESVEIGDRYIGPLALSQLHFCVAGIETDVEPADATKRVEAMARDRLRESGVEFVEEDVILDVAIAKSYVLDAKERREKTLSQWV